MNNREKFNSFVETLPSAVERETFKKISLKEDVPVFWTRGNIGYFIEDPSKGFTEKSNDVIVNKIKLWIKKSPIAFFIIYRLVGASFVGTSSAKALADIPKGKIILNLGSGVTSLREDVINIDFYPFKNVHFVADILHLPFADGSVDAVVCEYVLEHVPDPTAIVAEMKRVLKPGGLIYVSVPFHASFHSAPADFYRWSKMGLRTEMKDFEEKECAIRSGPGASMDYALAEFLATLLSFGSRKIHQLFFVIFLVLFAPLCYLDYLIARYPTSENIAYGFYFIGCKK